MLKLGIERISEYKSLFKGKSVGLITNPTGVDQNFKSTIDILNVNTYLKALFSPEHGIRGNLQAGVKLDSYTDSETGITVYSLYGEKRAPTEEMLEGIDIIAYDIQDVGVRFYTYISTLAYTMQAAKRHGKKMVVFDRPNYLGSKIEGNILNLDYRSFIGYYPMPQRYGLTVGELALFYNEAMEIACDLTVIPMSGYKRDMLAFDYNLPYVLPSPNIPTKEAVFAYAANCIFEGTNVSEGRGTTKPFQIIGAPWLDSKVLLNALEKHNLKGVTFRPLYFTPVMSKHKDIVCSGIEMYITDYHAFEAIYTGMVLLKEIGNTHKEFSFNPPWSEGGKKMIDLNVGDAFISNHTLSLEEIKTKQIEDQKTFDKLTKGYHLYD
ncbi:MAG: DUF1343 domain-containing protein [Acholeplasmataceae bacterium]|nr:DUF1343 domain-containing protein [Acholeplasmataceae bacterium]